jgi:hypothetical protein
MQRPDLRVVVAVGLVAGSVLALQVLLTRLLSAVVFYHFGFLAISLALLGAGAGAILIYVRPGWFAANGLRPALARWSVVLSLLLIAVPAVIVRLDYDYTGAIGAGFVLNLGLACLLATLPFAAAGIVIALAIRGYARWIDRVYAFDLAGASLGAVAIVPLLWLVDAPTLFVALGLVAALAALMFAPAGTARRAALAAGAVAAAALVLAAATSLYAVPPSVPIADRVDPVSDRWTPLSRVLGFPPVGDARFAAVNYDRVYAPVPRVRPGGPLPDWRTLGTGAQSIGYELTGPGHALVIGGGGGRDIENALTQRQRVDVIELNDAIRRTVDEDLGEWSGSPYSLPKVDTAIGDGRSILARRDRRYDQIHIGFTDTWSGNSAQAFALTENNLYTLEAFEEYLDHLRPGGVLNVSRLRRALGDEALRATVLTLEALRRHGVENPERNVVVLLGVDIFREPYGTVLARLEPWTRAELDRIERLARERSEGIVFAPDGPYRLEWARLAAAPSPLAFCEDWRLDVCPPTDDRPFFFNMTRLGSVGDGTPAGYVTSVDPFLVLLITLGILVALCAVAFAVPLALGPREGRPPLSSLSFFAAIGLGFLVLEVVLIQRFVLFLGFPTYALSIVLFALLLFTGAGSLMSTRLGEPRRTLVAALAVAAVLIAAAAAGLQPLLRALIDLPFALRVVVSVLVIAPFGLVLGTAMPIGLRRLGARYPVGIPWAWGINGITSVIASVLAVAVAIAFGFTAATLVALACYLAALAHALLGSWPERGELVDAGAAQRSRRAHERAENGAEVGAPGAAVRE